MSENLSPVESTQHKDFFDDVPANTVFVYERSCGEALWEDVIGKKSTSYFSLPDDNWVVSKESRKIGEWIEAYNNDENKIVGDILQRELDWGFDTKVRFFGKKSVVLETSWKSFLLHWDGFLALEDDCPILVKDGDIETGILFTGTGDILVINN
ncbi:DUF2947 family protein [Shewanella cutis]|uniref:DUF2947 family protein n=1 Tax=Shewanella cutis TaxID=2766780 RepID=A0ABS9QQZ6_9GAMM|nr:DUF2947 family protein [Shewanella sp. PS-2]MCG9962786.1 DUF2947 family protein [Shewanella sp. PS-2]